MLKVLSDTYVAADAGCVTLLSLLDFSAAFVSMVVLGCNHRMTINCSSHGHVQLLLVHAPSTPPDQHPGIFYPLRFVIRQSHWEPLSRC